MSYDDTILIKLRRDYSENETIMYALNKIKELQIENGKQASYIQELEHYKKIDVRNLKEKDRAVFSVMKIKLSNFKFKIESLEKSLEKQLLHSRRKESECSFLLNKLMSVLSESQIIEFRKERDVFEKKLYPKKN